jgi:hypothetical protein
MTVAFFPRLTDSGQIRTGRVVLRRPIPSGLAIFCEKKPQKRRFAGQQSN